MMPHFRQGPTLNAVPWSVALGALLIAIGCCLAAPGSVGAGPTVGQTVPAISQQEIVEQPDDRLLLNEPVGELPVVADGRWSAPLTENWGAAVLVWVLLLIGLQLAGWPLAWLVFGRFADLGWGFARLITLLVAGYLVWLGASLQIISFRAGWAGAAIALVAGVGWVARRWWPRARSWPRQDARRQRTIVASEIVFWSVFACFGLLRYVNPDAWHPLWGGEKPMEFAHINAILRSAHFPPLDPWYADGYINYYYYGLYLIAYCFKLTGIPSEIGFNLAQPTIFALLASGAFSLAATLGRDITGRPRLAIGAGLVGTILTIFSGNLAAVFKLLRGPEGTIRDPFTYWVWDASRAIDFTITEFPFFTALYADLHAHVVALPITVLATALAYAIARSPRQLVLALRRPRRQRSVAAAVISRLGLLALGLGSLSVTNVWDVPTYLALTAVALVMATAPLRSFGPRLLWAGGLIGGVGVAAYVLFLPFFWHYVALFGSLGVVRDPTALSQFGEHLGGFVAVVGVGLVVTLLPVARVPRWLRSPAVPLLVVLALLVGWSVTSGGLASREPMWASSLVVVVAVLLGGAAWAGSAQADRGGTIGRLFIAVGIAAVGTALLVGRPTLAALLAVTVAAGVTWLIGKIVALRFTGAMVAAAALLGAGVELVYLVDNLAGTEYYRMNTVFKFYNQLWLLLALAAVALIARMAVEVGWTARSWPGLGGGGALGLVPSWSETAARPQGMDGAGEAKPVRAAVRLGEPPSVRWSRAGLVVAVVVLVASLAYPVSATVPRLQQRFADGWSARTLDGLAWMEYGTITNAFGEPISFRGDQAAIAWLNEHVAGTPVIAEASIGAYRGNGSRIANATGLPTILGWLNHQTQQRDPGDLFRRERDVQTLYDSPDVTIKLDILDRYNVTYLIVGDVERKTTWPAGQRYASAAGIAAFDAMVGQSLDVVFKAEGTVIYRVRR